VGWEAMAGPSVTCFAHVPSIGAGGGEKIMAHFVIIVDGTGDFGDADYEASMRLSFCSQMALQLGGSAAYLRGPSMDGFAMEGKIDWAIYRAIEAHDRDPNIRLMLAGYSRGGSAAIGAVERLKWLRTGIEVDSMFLFDPVARHISIGGTIIPSNVKRVWSATRKLDPEFVAKYDNTIGSARRLLGAVGGSVPFVPRVIGQNPARVFFGKTGATYLGDQSKFVHKDFLGSHGALGGVGWAHVTEDRMCQIKVAKWMNDAFGQAGLGCVIKSYGNTGKA
jgi:hypothetical protein